jgi:hypothetical protein
MSVQGVNQNLLQLLNSNDKNVQDFLSALKPGDTLKGRVVEILPGENKAVINFKGLNIVSELPQNSTLQKGQVINVSVSQINDRVIMKLADTLPAELGKGIEAAAERQISPQQIIQLLNTIKAPVNEQNIFIAQKLMDYHIPVTSQNMTEINNALSSYMENKGIDINAFNIETPQSAKEVLTANIIKFTIELAAAAENAQAGTKSTATKSNQAFIPSSSANDKRSMSESAGEVITSDAVLAENDRASVSLFSRQQIANKLENLLNTVSSIASSVTDAEISVNNGTLSIIINDAPSGAMKNAAALTAAEGLITQQDAEAVIAAVSTGKPAVINAGSIRISSFSNGNMEINITSVKENLEALSNPGLNTQAAEPQSINNMKDIIFSKLSAAPETVSTAAVNVVSTPDLINVVKQDAKETVMSMRENFTALKSAVLNTANTGMTQNIRDIETVLVKLNAAVSMLDNSKTLDTGKLDQQQADYFTKEIGKLDANVLQLMQKTGLAGDAGEISASVKDYINMQAAVKEFVNTAGDQDIIQPAAGDTAQKTYFPIQGNVKFDVESTIESLVFLKSRNISMNNEKFVDTMGKYFKNDMKLNSNIENLRSAITVLDGMKDAVTDVSKENISAVKTIYSAADSIKTMIKQLAINPQEGGMKQQVVEQQLKDFIRSSGLNLESNLKQDLMAAEQRAAVSIPVSAPVYQGQAAARQNLKSALMDLSNKIQELPSLNLTAEHKEAIKTVKDAAADVLTNLNAIQFINQKPASFDMIYAQLPILFNNKLFNGEVQVWYRKGSLKENLERSVPVNIVFMLNTSNLGNVKISMTIYKKEVECVVNAADERAKQLLMRSKSDFLSGIDNIKYNMKAFQITVDGTQAAGVPSSGDGYVNLGRINIEA